MEENNFLAIKKVPANKSEQKILASQFVEAVTNGDINPIDAVVQMKSLNETIASFLKDSEVSEAVIKECEKYGKGEYPSYKGAVVSVKESGVKYDYSACKDTEWNDLNSQLTEIKERMKEREKYLHAISKPKTELDEITGEVYSLSCCEDIYNYILCNFC